MDTIFVLDEYLSCGVYSWNTTHVNLRMPSMRKTIEISCYFCGIPFSREVRYVTRNQKLDRHNFCSISCSRKQLLIDQPELRKNVVPGARTTFNPFKKYLASAKHRAKVKNRSCTISVYDLAEKWAQQNGCCALSGLPLVLPIRSRQTMKRDPFMASLDRINSSIGYDTTNIQWVCLLGQNAKNSFTMKDLDKFCAAYTFKNRSDRI